MHTSKPDTGVFAYRNRLKVLLYCWGGGGLKEKSTLVWTIYTIHQVPNVTRVTIYKGETNRITIYMRIVDMI